MLKSFSNTSLNVTDALFAPSKDIRVFPCGWRGATSLENLASDTTDVVTVVSFDQEARLNTERNFTHLTGNHGGYNTYIIPYAGSDSLSTSYPLCFSINGYYFELTFSESDDADDIVAKAKEGYTCAVIRINDVELSSATDSNEVSYVEQTGVLSTWLANAKRIDYCEDSSLLATVDGYLFAGLAFVKEDNAILSKYPYIKLFDEDGSLYKASIYHIDDAENVVTSIGGKAITNIFESNGTTVKKATSATSATTATKATYATVLGSNENGFSVGSSAQPVYFSKGVPLATSTIKGNDNTYRNHGSAISNLYELAKSTDTSISEINEKLVAIQNTSVNGYFQECTESEISNLF